VVGDEMEAAEALEANGVVEAIEATGKGWVLVDEDAAQSTEGEEW
jgi:hypothetical protein